MRAVYELKSIVVHVIPTYSFNSRPQLTRIESFLLPVNAVHFNKNLIHFFLQIVLFSGEHSEQRWKHPSARGLSESSRRQRAADSHVIKSMSNSQ